MWIFALTLSALAGDDARAAFGKNLETAIVKGASKELPRKSAKDLPAVITYAGALAHGEDQDLEANPLLRSECVTEAIRIRTQMVGAKQAASDIAKWKAKLANNEMSEGEYWKEILECKDYCAQIMVDSLNCYINSSANSFRGIFLFDYGVGDFQAQTRGDQYSRGLVNDNEKTMQQVVAFLEIHPGDHVMLEGRASRGGNDVSNSRLSGKRSGAVKAELLARGVDAARIHIRWIGEGEPYFRPELAAKYNIPEVYAAFGQETMNQSVSVYLFTPGSTPPAVPVVAPGAPAVPVAAPGAPAVPVAAPGAPTEAPPPAPGAPAVPVAAPGAPTEAPPPAPQ